MGAAFVASGLTANAANNVLPSAGSGVARLADLNASVVVPALRPQAAPRTPTPAPSLVGSGGEGTETVTSPRTFPSLHGFKLRAGRTQSAPCPPAATPTAATAPGAPA